MSLGKGDPVPPPPGPDEYEVRFGSRDAAEGWKVLCKQASGNALWAWEQMRKHPAPTAPRTTRHHQLKGPLAAAVRNGRALPLWQIEVTSGGRVWYLFDENKRTCWLIKASMGHPRETD